MEQPEVTLEQLVEQLKKERMTGLAMVAEGTAMVQRTTAQIEGVQMAIRLAEINAKETNDARH